MIEVEGNKVDKAAEAVKVSPDSCGSAPMGLFDCLYLLYRRGYFIVAASALPAIVFGIFSFFAPRSYSVTYTYSWNFSEADYRIFLERFYGRDNMEYLAEQLRAAGVPEHGGRAGVAGKELKEMVRFEAWQPFVDLGGIPPANRPEYTGVEKRKTQLILMTVRGASSELLERFSRIVREDVESILPALLQKQNLMADICKHKEEMARIEGARYTSVESLETDKVILSRLKALRPETEEASGLTPNLSFNLDEKSEFLPLGIRVQAAENRIIEMEEELAGVERQYDYYGRLAALNEQIVEEIESHQASDYSLASFHLYLKNLSGRIESRDEADYLSSYIKRLEIAISTQRPAVLNPSVSSTDRYSMKNVVIIFSVVFVFSVFAVLLVESVRSGRRAAA